MTPRRRDNQRINQSTNQPINQSTNQPTNRRTAHALFLRLHLMLCKVKDGPDVVEDGHDLVARVHEPATSGRSVGWYRNESGVDDGRVPGGVRCRAGDGECSTSARPGRHARVPSRQTNQDRRNRDVLCRCDVFIDVDRFECCCKVRKEPRLVRCTRHGWLLVDERERISDSQNAALSRAKHWLCSFDAPYVDMVWSYSLYG